MTAFVFRSWPADQTQRLKELWWDGKTPAEIFRILGAASARAVYDKAVREGFVRDPRLVKAKPEELLPIVSRETNELVTLRNCTSRQCRWGYGPPDADMILCGRETVMRGPWCAGHRAMTYLRDKPVVR